MSKNKRIFLKGKGATAYLLCFACSALLIILTSFVFALIANASGDPTKNLGIFSFVSLLISAVAGGFVSTKIIKNLTIAHSLLISMAISLVMLIICIISCGGRISGGAFMNYGCYVGLYVMSALLGKRTGARRKRHHK